MFKEDNAFLQEGVAEEGAFDAGGGDSDAEEFVEFVFGEAFCVRERFVENFFGKDGHGGL